MASSAVAQPPQGDSLAGTVGGLVSLLIEGTHDSQYGRPALAVAGTLFALLLAIRLFLTPHVDPREPPIIKPAVPVIGHIIGLMSKGQLFYKQLYEKTHMPIATVPMLNGKLYAIYSPVLVKSALRHRGLSFEPFVLEAAAGFAGLDKEGEKLIRTEGLLPAHGLGNHTGMMPEFLHAMDARALARLARPFNAIGRGGAEPQLKVPNMFLFLRGLVTEATCEALYGDPNPFHGDPNFIKDLWNYDEGIMLLFPNVFPSLIAPRAHRARARLQAVLMDHYGKQLDQDPTAAEVTRRRATALRTHGASDRVAGKLEVSLLQVSTTNSGPAMYWFAANVFARPELVARLRAELDPYVRLAPREGGGRTASVSVADFEARCPLLVSAYRETHRVANYCLGNRRVVEDTVLRDGDGREYLLKKGCNVQLPAMVPHQMPEIWGPDAAEFRADRFVPADAPEGGAEAEKLRRSAFFPFGGGKNLCPGRHFAFAELLGLVCTMVVGYEVEAAEGGGPPVVTGFRTPKLTQGFVTPVRNGEGTGVVIRRRPGWEDVVWTYEV